MASAVADHRLSLHADDLLDVLRPRTVLLWAGMAAAFGIMAMELHAGRWILLGVVVCGALLSLYSPRLGFAICVFLFAFRNDAFMLGPFKIADPLFAVTATSWLGHALARGKLRLHGSLIAATLYVVTALASGLAAEYGSFFAMDAVRLGYLVLIFFLGVQTLGTREALLQALKAFLAAAMVMAVCSVLWALWMFVLHRAAEPFYKPEEGLRCESIAVDPLRVAAFLIFPMLLMAGLQQRARTRGERGWATALFWLGMVSCGLCVSRSAVLQILPGLFFFWLLTRRHLGKLVLLAAALAAMTLTFSLLLPRLVGIERYELGRWALLRGSDESLVESRVLIWRATWEAFSENPWLGVGLDNFRPRYYEFRDPWLARGWIYVQAKPPHSTYASVLVETGIVGLLGFVVLVAYFFFLGRITVLQARRDQDLARYLVAAAAFSAFAAHLIAGIALELLSHNHLWVIMAITTVIDTRRPGRGTATLGAASEAQRPGGQQLGSGTVAEAPY